MRIKIGKVEVNFSLLLVLFGLLVADNVYSNHCKKKTINQFLKMYGES